MVKRMGLFGGPLLGLLCYSLLPPHYATAPGAWVEFTQAGRAPLALMVWMAGWWLTEAVDIEATALLPIVTFPLLGIAPLTKVLQPYAADVIFLFMGGYIIGLAIERWGLDRRIAFCILHLVGARPGAIVGGFMAVTAFLSMWVSNTACAAMMVPIALSVVDLVLRTRTGAGLQASGGIPQDRIPERNFATGLLLCIAYAASIGGIAAIIGSPPNGIAVRYVQQTFGKDVSFFKWLLVGGPFTLIFLPIAWLLVTRVLFRANIGEIKGGREYFDEEYRKLGPLAPGEKIVLAVFSVTAFLWICSPLLKDIAVAGVKPLAGLSDTGIAMLAAMALFVIPADRARGTRAMDWHTAVKLPWGVLVLFGGGLTLAAAIEANGVSAFIGHASRGLAGLPPPPAAARDHYHDGVLVRAHFQYGAGRDDGAGARGHGAGTRDEPLCPDHRVYARCELRLHDAGGNTPERDRVRHRAGATAANDEGRLLAEPRWHPAHHSAGHAVHYAVARQRGLAQ
jgi:sodium-dependent dicarboxylate transporter 2/3/5